MADEGIIVRIDAKDIEKLAAALRAADGRTPKEIQVANINSAEIAVRRAKVLAPKGAHQGGGRPQQLASAISSQAGTTKAYISFGGTRAPHGAVVNFGGVIPRYHSTASTHVRRQEHIYSGIAQTTPRRVQEYEDAITRIVRSLS